MFYQNEVLQFGSKLLFSRSTFSEIDKIVNNGDLRYNFRNYYDTIYIHNGTSGFIPITQMMTEVEIYLFELRANLTDRIRIRAALLLMDP